MFWPGSDLVAEIGWKVLGIFTGPEVIQALGQVLLLAVWFVLASENVPQQLDVGEPLADGAGRSRVTPVAFHQLGLLQGLVRLRPGRVRVRNTKWNRRKDPVLSHTT